MGTRALRPDDHIKRAFSPEVPEHVARLEEVCARHNVTLLAAALQQVVRQCSSGVTLPGRRFGE